VINLLNYFPPEYERFLSSHSIQYFHLPVKGNKLHCEEMDREKTKRALSLLIDKRNYPIIIHCRSGKHRSGALIGCLRIVQGWELSPACDEYVLFCKHKQRYVDKQFIERFDPRSLFDSLPPLEYFPPWLPIDCASFASPLEMAISSGQVLASAFEAGITVDATFRGPDEPWSSEFLTALRLSKSTLPLPAFLRDATLGSEAAGSPKDESAISTRDGSADEEE
jgi:hypothetical protein